MHGWRLADRKDMRMSGYGARVRSLDWSVGGKWLSTSGSTKLILWPFQGKDWQMGKQPRILAPSEHRVTVVACHPRQDIVAAGYADGMIAPLVGQWLSQHVHRQFVERGRDGAGGLAAEAFYDKLAYNFADGAPFVAALVSRGRTTPGASDGAASLQPGVTNGLSVENSDALSSFMNGAEFTRWTFRGRVRAYLSSKTATAQVTFGGLPGGIDLLSTDKFASSISRTLERAHDVTAWYGFGVPIGSPAETIMMLRDEIAGPRRAEIELRAVAYV